MAKLVVSYKDDVKEYELDKEVLTIGRKSDNDIHLENLAVSNNHAKVITILNDSFIEDLNSTNGTLINGNKITKHALKNGESFIIGKHELKYVNADVESDDSIFENTMILRPDAESMEKTEHARNTIEKTIGEIKAGISSTAATTTGPGPAKLQLLSGENAGKELALTKILTTLGKPGVQVAAITRRPTGYFLIIVDAGKDNKRPLVNGSEMGKQQMLNDGDAIEVAGVMMSFILT